MPLRGSSRKRGGRKSPSKVSRRKASKNKTGTRASRSRKSKRDTSCSPCLRRRRSGCGKKKKSRRLYLSPRRSCFRVERPPCSRPTSPGRFRLGDDNRTYMSVYDSRQGTYVWKRI